MNNNNLYSGNAFNFVLAIGLKMRTQFTSPLEQAIRLPVSCRNLVSTNIAGPFNSERFYLHVDYEMEQNCVLLRSANSLNVLLNLDRIIHLDLHFSNDDYNVYLRFIVDECHLER